MIVYAIACVYDVEESRTCENRMHLIRCGINPIPHIPAKTAPTTTIPHPECQIQITNTNILATSASVSLHISPDAARVDKVSIGSSGAARGANIRYFIQEVPHRRTHRPPRSCVARGYSFRSRSSAFEGVPTNLERLLTTVALAVSL